MKKEDNKIDYLNCFQVQSNQYNELKRTVYDGMSNISFSVDELERNFKKATGLSEKEVCLLCIASALQCARILLINNLTKIEKAGQGNKKEESINTNKEKILKKFDNTEQESHKYFASRKHIVSTRGVPYDTTGYKSEKYGLFKGANHRFSTLGHDPAVGLIFGTANILTNTITCIDDKKFIRTHHVDYDRDMKNPRIAEQASTSIMFKEVINRIKNDKESVIAAIIKQVCHIASDLYTPCGIQLIAENIILGPRLTEKVTKILSMGDILKFNISGGAESFIDFIITVLHAWMEVDKLGNEESLSAKEFKIRNRKIIDYSNGIATGSNVIASMASAVTGISSGNGLMVIKSVKDVDWCGIEKLFKNLCEDKRIIYEVKREFFEMYFRKRLWGK